MERSISPIGEDWQGGEAIASLISNWERSSGLTLPADYRAFLIRYDGGRPYPNMFRHSALSPDDGSVNPTEHFLDQLYSWDRVVAWSDELGDRLPGGCLTIGADPGLLEIVISLRPEDFGAVYSWVRSWTSWGSVENAYLCPQGQSFGAFVTSLFDDEDESGHDYWHTPRVECLKRPLEL
jgi:hypothetical protein